MAKLGETKDVVAIAVMPDVHLASEVCIGVALATTSTLYPAAVGSDIGCGMAAIGFDIEADAVADRGPELLAALTARIPVLGHRSRDCPALPEQLADAPLSAAPLERTKLREGKLQLGTLGRGNHFVELQRDDHGGLWAMVHTGSRGIGQAIRTWHEQAGFDPGPGPGLRGIVADSPEGRAYLDDLAWALAYAAENRRRIVTALAELLDERLGTSPLSDTTIECQHNFVRRERHELDGRVQELWVHRKGASSARDGELGVIPGSMGTASFHVEGRGEPRSLCSSSHGAGRALARGEAFRTITSKQLRRELRGVWFDERLVERLRDEAPGAYKDIGAVMKAQRELTRVTRRLRPVLAFKGG